MSRHSEDKAWDDSPIAEAKGGFRGIDGLMSPRSFLWPSLYQLAPDPFGVWKFILFPWARPPSWGGGPPSGPPGSGPRRSRDRALFRDVTERPGEEARLFRPRPLVIPSPCPRFSRSPGHEMTRFLKNGNREL